MAATIEGAFVLIDKASSTMKKMEQQAVKTMAAIEGVGAAQDAQTKRGSTAARAMEGNSGELKNMEKGATSAERALDKLGKTSEQSSQRVGKLERAIARMRAELGRLKGGGGGGGASSMSGLRGIQSDLKNTQTAIGSFLGSFGVLGSALMAFKLPAIGTGITMLVQSITALGGAAVAALPGIAALAGGINAFPSVVGAGIQGLFSLKMAFQGVMQAVQAGMQAQNQWAYNQREYQQQLLGANDAVISAHQGLTNAIYAQQQAQIQLTVARRDATRTLNDMEFAANTAVLREARAGLNIQQAKQELQQAMMSPGTSPLQIQSLRLGVMEAVTSAQQTHTEATRNIADAARARRGDPTSAPVMQVTAARHQVAQSTIEISNAERGLIRSQQALNNLLMQGNAGVSAYKRQLMALGPAQQAIVKFLVGSMGPNSKGFIHEFQGMQNAAAQGMVAPLEHGVRTLMGAFPMLDRQMRSTTSVLGGLGSRLVDTFFGPRSIGQTNSIMSSNVRVMRSGSDAIVHLADMLRQLMVAAEPTVEWLARMVDTWTKAHDAVMKTARGQDALREKFAKFRTELSEVHRLFSNLWRLFHNLNAAAWDLNQTLTRGAISGTGSLADKIAPGTRGAQKLHDWFMGLLPLLRALGKLVEALGRGLGTLTSPTANQGTARLVGGLTRLVPVLAKIMLALERAFGPPIISALGALGQGLGTLAGSSGPLGVFLTVLGGIVKAFDALLKLPGVGRGLVIFLGTLFAVRTVAAYVQKLLGVAVAVKSIRDRWREAGAAQRRASRGMASPGTTAGGLGSRTWGTLTGGAVAGEQLSHTWGIRSLGGPGSETNPLVVRVQGGGIGSGSAGNPFAGGSPTSTLAKDAKAGENVVADASKLTKAERVGAMLAGIPVIGGLAKKLPSALGRGAGMAGEAGALAGELGKFGKFAAGAGKFFGVAGLALSALPAITAFIGTKGNFGERASAAGAGLVNSLTFGLTNFQGTPTNAQQRTKGYGYAARDVTLSSQAANQAQRFGGDWSQAFMARAGQSVSALQRQINEIQHPAASRGRYGVLMPSSVDQKKLLARQAELKALNAAIAQEQTQAGQQAAQSWGQAFDAGSQRHGPKWAMGQTLAGMQLSMATLTKRGKSSMLQNMEQWGQTLVQNDPKMRKPVDRLNKWIVASFAAMGQRVQIVNGQILTGSTQEWDQISSAMTNPILVAQEKMSGSFGAIAKMAIGSLQAMGYNKGQAQALVGNLTAKASGATNINATGMGAQHGGSYAGGGRVPGKNPRDVYQYGSNMLGGGELVMNKHHEMEANARLLRHGEPTVGSIVSSRTTPNWAFASGGRAAGQAFPFPKGESFSWQRIDQGQDLEGPPGGPVLAIGPGVVSSASDRFGGFGPFYATEQITGGPLAGRGVYYGHTKVSRTGPVKAGDVIAYTQPRANDWTAAPAGWLELGFLPYGNMNAGAAIAPILHQMAGGAMVTATGGVGGGSKAAQQIPALKPPKITGLGGVPYLLAQTGTNAFAAGLTKQINKKLAGGGTNFAGVPGVGGTAAQNQTLGKSMMLAAGWGADQWPALRALWTQESGWDANAVNPTSGAYGIPQSLGHGHPYNLGDARGQIGWGLNYIRGRYGSPNAAEAHEKAFNWYSGGGRTNWAGWHRNGGTFLTNGPTIFGAGEGGHQERVHIEPAHANSTRPINITIEKIEVHRKGDIKKIVDEELAALADSLEGRA